VAVFAAAVEIPAAAVVAETAWQTDPAVGIAVAAGQTVAVEAAGGGEQQLAVFFWDQTVPGAWDQAWQDLAAVAGPRSCSAWG